MTLFATDIQHDLAEGEVGVGDALGRDTATVAILAGKPCGLVWLHGQLPQLEALRRNRSPSLCEGNFVEQPVRASGVGHVLCTIGEKL